MNEKRNPSIVRGDGETVESYSRRLDEYISRIEWQSEGHRTWYTHKNPSGCWICELLQVARIGSDYIVPTVRPEGVSQSEQDLNYDDEPDLNSSKSEEL